MMCKKFAMFTGVVVALLAVLSVTKVGSYMATGWGKFEKRAANSVPIEFEIERLKNQVGQLIPDMRKHLSTVAEGMADVERLNRDITTTKANLDEQKTRLVQMAKDLETQETQFIYAGKIYSREIVAKKLEADYKSYNRVLNEVKTKEQLLSIKQRELDAAREQLTTIKDQEQQLKVQIAELEAELKTVRLAETKSKFQIDDSRLSDVKRSIEQLRFRLDAERKKAELDAEFFGNEFVQGVDKPAARPVSEVAREIREKLEGSRVVDQK